MVSFVGCADKNRLKRIDKNPCLDCNKRWKGCSRKHELIDSSIFCNCYLHKQDVEKWRGLLKLNGIKYSGYITTIQIGHIVRAFNVEFHKLEIKKQDTTSLEDDFKECMLELTKFQVLDFDKNAQKVYNELLEKEILYMESHDKMNVAIAIWNDLYIQVRDSDLEHEYQTIKEIANGFGKTHIKINEKYDS